MHREQYVKIENHPLRAVFRGLVGPSDQLPTRSALRAMIDEAVPAGTDAKVRDALYTKAIELAQKASNDRGSWWDLRGAADRFVLDVVEKFDAADRI